MDLDWRWLLPDVFQVAPHSLSVSVLGFSLQFLWPDEKEKINRAWGYGLSLGFFRWGILLNSESPFVNIYSREPYIGHWFYAER